MNNDIQQRVEALRAWMRSRGFDAFVVPSTDPHGSEYVAPHWECRQWISGFTGSAGTAIVTLHAAALWTDSRYWLAAEEQLAGTPFELMRQGHPDTPSPAIWLKAQGCTRVACDPWVNDNGGRPNDPEQLTMTWTGKESAQLDGVDPFAEIWTDRPALPQGEIVRQPMKWAGQSTQEKLDTLRQCMRSRGADATLLTALDDIAWVLNLRGDDVHCTPVFVAYLLVRHDSATVYTYHRLPEVEGVKVEPYEAIVPALQDMKGRLMMQTSCVNLALQSIVRCTVLDGTPLPHIKTIKNEAEQAGFRSAMLKDGIAMTRFLRELDEWAAAPSAQVPSASGGTSVPGASAAGSPSGSGGATLTEVAVDRRLTALRAEQEGFLDLSFDTIAGYGPHGAIVHYEATEETDIPLERHGLLLLDSGGQYEEGTTDITRTIPLGPLTDAERRDYTLVLMGHIDLARACFPEESSGTQLDVLARQHLWREGSDYGHGTGHGVGSRLSVHEGPHQFRKNWMPAPLKPGMTITVEPGIYRAGSHGVRIENTMLIVPLGASPLSQAPSASGGASVPGASAAGCVAGWCEMEPLTLCPIDTRPIVRELLEPHHIQYLNSYHAYVLRMLGPHLSGADLEWLQQACQPL